MVTKQISSLRKTHILSWIPKKSEIIIREIHESLKSVESPKIRINEEMIFQQEFQNKHDLNAVMQRIAAGESL